MVGYRYQRSLGSPLPTGGRQSRQPCHTTRCRNREARDPSQQPGPAEGIRKDQCSPQRIPGKSPQVPKSTLDEDIKRPQRDHPSPRKLVKEVKQGKSQYFRSDEHCMLWMDNQICVPDQAELTQRVLCEAHECAYPLHPGYHQICRDIRKVFW